MKKSEVVTILGSQSYKCENYNSHIVSWSPPEDSSTLIYTTVNSNEIIRITNRWEYFEYIYDDKGRDLLSNKKCSGFPSIFYVLTKNQFKVWSS